MISMGTLRRMLVFILLIFSALTSLGVHANAYINTPLCDATSVEQMIEAKTIKHLEISTPKSKKWVKNYFKALKSPGNVIVKKYKKKFDANIGVIFDNGVSCNFSAKIRINGDYKDHITSAPPITSLDVKLLSGNINSVVKFKLFLPHTRGGDNEVFSTALLRELGFLAPRTYRVSAFFNDQKVEFLFQEKITKEFVEKNNLREAPILEGDERFTHDVASDIKFNLARIVNKSWAKKGETSLDISKSALSQLNKAYIDNLLRQYSYQSTREKFLPINALSQERHRDEDREFKSIMIAIEAHHGITTHNRKFYYDPIYEYFKPIYYDGDADIVILGNPSMKLIIKENLNVDQIIGAKSALRSFGKLDRKGFYNRLRGLRLKYSLNEVNAVLDRIVVNLKGMSTSTIKSFKNQYLPFFSQYKFLDTNKKLVFSEVDNLRIEICNLGLTSCYFDILNIQEYAELLQGKYLDSSDNEYIFIGDKQEYVTGINIPKNNQPNIFDIENGVQLTTYGSMRSLISKESKKIELHQGNINDRALINGGVLKDWHIKFSGVTGKIEGKQRFNQNLLTGCLTLLDMSVDNIDIEVERALCEDGVNLIRVSGNLNSVIVNNAMSDAIDVDFSVLRFENIKVSNAGNDCVDLSAGDYQIQDIDLTKCKDKAISVGEGSELTLDSVKVSSSSAGIVTKDSSIVKVKSATINDTPICFSAYNKKQEFWGAKITVDRHNCQPSQNFQKQGSLIEFKQ
ncbi:hypothetical protein OAM42_01580 [Candidatus Thioglobus sp.]|nr:hypothetical protein [Candidatus Thioglobus sp.]